VPQKNISPTNIIQLTKFTVEEDQAYTMQVSNVLLLMPFFKWDEVQGIWIDATGDYDLCMSENGLKYYFTSRIPGPTTYGYRYVSSFFPASALEDQTRKHGNR
jgi:hypothetical protein